MNRILKAKIVEHFGTQADFAVASDEDESFVSRVVQCRRKLSPERQEVWAELLKSKAEDIFR